jgi:peptidoglycan hydrolase-like protein with peptidoglycan-binding domain
LLSGGAPVPAAAPAVATASSGIDMNTTIRVGSRGETVRALQQKLGLTADGSFGPGTEAAVKKWQASNGLTADGVVGPRTLAKMFG